MSRAIFALIKGDLAAYIQYNAMALPIAAVFLCELFEKAFRHKTALHIATASVAIINIVYYLYRLFNNTV